MAEEVANNIQMGQIEARKLVRRAGGKNATTQLNKGDTEIVVQMKNIDPKFSKTTTKGLKTTTKLRDHTTITVNLDDQTDRPHTMVDFKTVDAKIAAINASGAPKWL